MSSSVAHWEACILVASLADPEQESILATINKKKASECNYAHGDGFNIDHPASATVSP